MAKKLALTAAILVALLALATATTYTTTITTTAIDETNPGQCRQQLQGRQFRSCQRYLSERRGYNAEGDEELLALSTDNPRQQQENLRQCCEQLRNVNEPCRCEAIRQAVRQQQQHGGGFEGEQMQQVYEKARDLPRRCNMRPQQCQFRAIFV